MEEQRFEVERVKRELEEKMAEVTRIKETLQSSEKVSMREPSWRLANSSRFSRQFCLEAGCVLHITTWTFPPTFAAICLSGLRSLLSLLPDVGAN